MDTTSLLHAWLGHNMSGHCHLEIEIPHVLVLHKLLCMGGEKRQILDNQEKWDMQYTILSCMGSTLHHVVSPLLGAIIQF
jgi:metal-dependent HD superfamily phosphatase/phosphodiesterase